MVQWRDWEVMDLFEDPENLPLIWQMGLAEMTIDQRLHTYELLNPVHRLLDFWATRDEPQPLRPLGDRTDWTTATIHIHPVLRSDPIQSELSTAVNARQPFEISQYVPNVTRGAVRLPYGLAAALLPLWDGPQSLAAIVDRFCQIEPVNPLTLGKIDRAAAERVVKQMIIQLETFLYVLVDFPG
jgi:hypothetical protein